MEKCCVLMSTYNGEKYISHQLDSILSQKNIDIDIYIRDDGSKDSTNLIISHYMYYYKNVHLIQGENVGVIESFRLVAEYVFNKCPRYEYYAFADQDDEWLPLKLSNAIIKIRDISISNEKPILYYSNLKVVDSDLNYLYDRFTKGYISNTKKQIMSEICVLGCTCVFNYCLLQEYVKTNLNQRIPHDAWIAVLATFLGVIIYDDNSYILYRQHGNNQSGSVKKGLPMYWGKIKRFKKIFDMDGDYESIAKEMLANYYNVLDKDDLNILSTISDYRNNFIYRFKLLFTGYISSGHLFKEITRRIRIIFNRL